MRAENVFSKDSLMQQAERLGWFEALGLPWYQDDQMFAELEKVTPEQVQAVAKKYLVSDREVLLYLKPKSGSPS